MNKDKDLNELRNEIRTIDKELVKLFEKRMTLCRAVGETKLKSQAPVFDAVREEENIRNLTALIENVTDKMYFTGWYRSLMDISKEIQRSICKKTGMNYGSFYGTVERIVYTSPDGTFCVLRMREKDSGKQ